MPRSCTCTGKPGQYCPRCAALLAQADGRLIRTDVVALFHAPHVAEESASIDRADGRQKPPTTDRHRSDTERRYAQVLQGRRLIGEIAEWYYEPCKGLYLAPRTSYTPDFLIWTPTGGLEFHEVKGGFIRAKDWEKTKWAAAYYRCFSFVLAQWKNAQWHYKTVPAF